MRYGIRWFKCKLKLPKNAEFKWTEQCQKSFELLKEALMKEPILKYPDPHEEYILYTDASKYAWAGVLTQEYQYDKDL